MEGISTVRGTVEGVHGKMPKGRVSTFRWVEEHGRKIRP